MITTKMPRKIMSSDKFKKLIKKYDEAGIIDREDFKDVRELCDFIDFYNSVVVRAKEKDFERELTGMNEYYWKLWIRNIEEQRSSH